MAKERFNMPVTNNTIRNIFTDAAGNEIDSFPYEQRTEMPDDNTILIQRTSHSKVISDGSVYNPAMSSGAHPERLGSCHFCEEAAQKGSGPARSSLLNLRFARRCYICSELGCPRHVKRSIDGEFRCRTCNIKFRVKRAFKRIFFRLEEEEYYL